MKTLKSLSICMFLMVFLGCDKKESDDINILDVEMYVELLRTGSYEPAELPEFSFNDIPALLAYRNEIQLITDFPVNMISSLSIPECSLGMYVLWTIESIRALAIDSGTLIGSFPSQNPIVEQRDEPHELGYGNEVQEIIATAYFNWWENNISAGFDTFKHIDPLESTDYQWH